MLVRVLLGSLRLYQKFLSPLLGDHCRFYPSCSQYLMDSVCELGAAKGMRVGLGRILRCNPFSSGGHDPIINYKSLV